MHVYPMSYADSFCVFDDISLCVCMCVHLYVCRERKRSNKHMKEVELSDLYKLIEEEIGVIVQWL